MLEQENDSYPDISMRKTRSNKGVLIIVPDPNTQTSHTYITSVAYLEYLITGRLKGNMMVCKYLGEGDYQQFLTKNDKKINFIRTKSDNPLDVKSAKERRQKELKNVDSW